MGTWFEGTNDIRCGIDELRQALEHPGRTFAGVVELMPGMTGVELVDEAPGSVTIRTDEGLMTRAHITGHDDADTLVLEFDEAYAAGSRLTTTAHFRHEFTPAEGGVQHRLVISEVAAPGFLGFFYRSFGGSNIGNAFLTAHKDFFEAEAA